MKQRSLMVGAGFSPVKRKILATTSAPEEDTAWTTLDMNEACNPDILFSLERIEYDPDPNVSGGLNRIPVGDETFDEVHAYEVLEHFGKQGDYVGYFRGFREWWRIIKPGGYLIGTCPAWNSIWAWSDPGHCRMINHGTLTYLCKDLYDKLGKNQASDYRSYVDPCWWELEHSMNPKDCPEAYVFALRKVCG